MESATFRGSRLLRRLGLTATLATSIIAVTANIPATGQTVQSAPDILSWLGDSSLTRAYPTTLAYVVQFYPLWFTYYQSQHATINHLIGPDRISPIYQIVVAINDDTLYASTFIDLTTQPLIVTVPGTSVTFSALILDPYGDIPKPGIPAQAPARYALTGPGYAGALPPGVTRVPVPTNFGTLIFRADKYSPTGVDQTTEAQDFRRSLQIQTLCEYLAATCPDGSPPDTSGGYTSILPEALFAQPYKTVADALLANDPITFLKQLQTAVASSNTPPLSSFEESLSRSFDKLFLHAESETEAFKSGAQEAYRLILNRYLTYRGATNWIHFTNIGAWGSRVIERSSITEFIQYGNAAGDAAYYQTFKDGKGAPLNGSPASGYVLTFPAEQIPQAKRFWSITAYTPDSIELIDNAANKYVVASYTPGLQYNADGSLSIYMATRLPSDVPAANWLPVPPGPFNLMLRVYGPEGSVADNTYVPPRVLTRSGH